MRCLTERMPMQLSQLMQQQLAQSTRQDIWLIEENSQSLNLQTFATEHCQARKMSNRIDLAKQFNAEFGDFEMQTWLSDSQHQATHIIFRIAKEKAINLHIINSCLNHLHFGSLTLYGFKNEGFKSLYNYTVEQVLNQSGLQATKQKHAKQLSSLCLSSQRQSIAHNLITETYSHTQTIQINGECFSSKPGQFGWQKIDLGSQLLLLQLKLYLAASKNHSSVKLLDLGCGYGFLSMGAHKLGIGHIDATDNCAAAIDSCRTNFIEKGIHGEVIADNCASNINTKYDIILSNPPFHQGFEHDVSLIERFIASSAKRLKPDGKAFFVVNQFVGIEKEAKKHFTKQQLLAKKDGFKILMLSH